VKYYNEETWENVQMRRRKNIVDNLSSQAKKFGILPDVQILWRTLSAELSAYIATGDDSLIQSINKYEGLWLDSPSSVPNVDLRKIIIGSLTI